MLPMDINNGPDAVVRSSVYVYVYVRSHRSHRSRVKNNDGKQELSLPRPRRCYGASGQLGCNDEKDRPR